MQLAGERMDEGFTEGTLLRIFVDEHDRSGAQPLYAAVMELLRKSGVAGATVFRGIEGYGGHREIHVARVLAWRPNLPIVIEVVDDPPVIAALIPQLHTMIEEGLITTEGLRYQRIAAASKKSEGE